MEKRPNGLHSIHLSRIQIFKVWVLFLFKVWLRLLKKSRLKLFLFGIRDKGIQDKPLEHGFGWRSAHSARMRAVHLNNSETERVHGSATSRVTGTSPPHFAAGRSTVKAESVSTHLDGRLASLTEAIPELARKTRERKRDTHT